MRWKKAMKSEVYNFCFRLSNTGIFYLNVKCFRISESSTTYRKLENLILEYFIFPV